MRFLSRVVCVAALAALTLLSGATAGVNTPHSGWYSGNPLLGPNTLTDLACSGSTCYASGEFGTLLKSTDGGTTWAGIVTGLTLNLSKVRLAGGSAERVVTGGGCALRRSDDGGDTFFRLPFSARDSGCPAGVASFSFPTDKSGYLLLADSRVLATADGGRSFSRRTAVPGGANDILCTADRTCFTTGQSIQRTGDGGVSWTQVGSAAGQPLIGIERADALTLYAVGSARTVVKSIDGGATWTRKTVGNNVPPANFRTIRCGSPLQCLITTEGNQVVRTTDGGETFASVVPSNDPTHAVAFAGATRAVAAGVFGSAEVSSDGGATWSAVGSRISGAFEVLEPVSDTVAYAGGRQGLLARTTDRGQSWANVSPPTDTAITALAGSGDRLYVLASDQALQRSDNGGQSYSLLNSGRGPFASLHAVDPDRLLLVGFRGVTRTADGGETFQQIADPDVRGALLTAADRAGNAAVVFGARRAAVSLDGGVAWTRIALPRKRLVRDLDFVTARAGFVLDTRGRLWRTSNGGLKWLELSSLGTNAAYSLEFVDANTGYVAIPAFGLLRNRGLVLRTADGGRSWHPQLVGKVPVSSIRTGGATDYALLAAEGNLIATTTRGDVGSRSVISLSARPRGLKKPGVIAVRGKLTPADGGEEILVARFSAGRWSAQTAVAASNGAFTTRWRMTRDAHFVAQVLGDADHVGAGTAALKVGVRPPKKRR